MKIVSTLLALAFLVSSVYSTREISYEKEIAEKEGNLRKAFFYIIKEVLKSSNGNVDKFGKTLQELEEKINYIQKLRRTLSDNLKRKEQIENEIECFLNSSCLNVESNPASLHSCKDSNLKESSSVSNSNDRILKLALLNKQEKQIDKEFYPIRTEVIRALIDVDNYLQKMYSQLEKDTKKKKYWSS